MARRGFDRPAGQLQRAGKRIVEWRDEMASRAVRQPRLDRRREPADQGKTIDPEREQPLRQRIDMFAREPEELERNGIIGRSVLDDLWREGGEISWQSAGHPAHDGMRVRAESRK